MLSGRCALMVVGLLMDMVVARCSLGQEFVAEITREVELPVEQPPAQETMVALPTVTPEAQDTAAQTPTTEPVATIEPGAQSDVIGELPTPTPELTGREATPALVTVERLLGSWISPLELPEGDLMIIPWESITFPPQRPGRAILVADDADSVEDVPYEVQGNQITFYLAAGALTYEVSFEADEMTLITSEGVAMVYCNWAPHHGKVPTCPHWPMGEQ